MLWSQTRATDWTVEIFEKHRTPKEEPVQKKEKRVMDLFSLRLREDVQVEMSVCVIMAGEGDGGIGSLEVVFEAMGI